MLNLIIRQILVNKNEFFVICRQTRVRYSYCTLKCPTTNFKWNKCDTNHSLYGN